jgi:tRNA threonylcarbamoyl adenosine modification protein (Sua5/YciO/YrdC/YwlC family)
VRKLARLKNRPDSDPIAVFVRSVKDMARYGCMTEIARTLAEAFLPGPLTLVLEATSNWGPPIVVAGKTGFRFSSSPVIQALVNIIGLPLTATSANRHDQPELATPSEIAASLGTEVDLYLDTGVLDRPTSTVVDCSGTEARVLREGYIAKDKIEKALKKRMSHG